MCFSIDTFVFDRLVVGVQEYFHGLALDIFQHTQRISLKLVLYLQNSDAADDVKKRCEVEVR